GASGSDNDFVVVASPPPGTLVVDLAGDSDDGNVSPGQLTLREAVRLANQQAGINTITFAPGLGPITLTGGDLALTDKTGATTIDGPNDGTQVIQRTGA